MAEKPAIDNVTAPGGGRIGLVHCPGTSAFGLLPGDTHALLDADLVTVRQWGAEALVTLLEPHEMTLLGIEAIGERAGVMGMQWWHLPITDCCAPAASFESHWHDAGPALHGILDGGGRLVLHCRAGLGRSGTIAARLLIERGLDADRAVTAVRRARPGAIENAEQVIWLRDYGAR